MDAQEYRLGDMIDDYCSRCKLLLNHAVASLVDGKVVKVVCGTCHNEHPFRNADVPQKKKKAPGARAVLFGQVLAKSAPAATPPVEAPEPVVAANEPPAKKKRAAAPARYISRHKTRPPRRGR